MKIMKQKTAINHHEIAINKNLDILYPQSKVDKFYFK